MGAGASTRGDSVQRPVSVLGSAVGSLRPHSRQEAYALEGEGGATGSTAGSYGGGILYPQDEVGVLPRKVKRPSYLPPSYITYVVSRRGTPTERPAAQPKEAEKAAAPRRHGVADEAAPVINITEANAAEVPPAPSPSYYIYKGQRFHHYLDFLQAVGAGTPKSHPTAEELAGPSQRSMVQRVRALFREYAGEGSDLAGEEFEGMAVSVAAEIGLDPDRFRSLSDAFDRFDINGDGRLDEEECVMLAESMLRYYADAMEPRRPRQLGMVELEVKRLEKHYLLQGKLGQGGQGTVYMAKELSSGMPRVVKIIDKSSSKAPLEEIKEEFRLLRALDHPRIQRLYDVFEDRSNVYLVAEPYYGGHLGDLIESAFERGVHVTAGYLARALHQVLQGVAYLHSMYITHCDLKESNIMVVSDGDYQDPSLVVIDFGLAHCFASRGTAGGTPGYMPPEVWARGLWTPKGDVHSLGVVIYQTYANGTRCFSGWGDEAMKKSTMNDMPDFDIITSAWPRCKDLLPLLEAMLQKDHRARPTAKACMEDSFFTKRVRPRIEECEADQEVVPSTVVESLQHLSQRTRLQRALHADMAARQNLAGLKQLNAAFDAMDSDHDGILTEAEVQAALRHEGMAEDLIEQVVQRLVGPEGQVAYTAFMGELLADKAVDEGRLLLCEFQELDTEGSGYLEKKHIVQLLRRPALAPIVGGRDADELMALMDLDGDGHVVFEEFRRALSSTVT